jgi:hypothetical protein
MSGTNPAASGNKNRFGFRNFSWSKRDDVSGQEKAPPSEPSATQPEKINDEIERSTELFAKDLILDLEQDNIQVNINSHIDNDVKIYRRYGEIDGTNGSRDYNIDTIALSHAAHLAESIVSKITGKLAGLSRQVADKTKDTETAEQDYKDAKSIHEDAVDFSQREPKNFNVPTALLYLFFSIILLLADIPVSLSLVGYLNVGSTGGAAELMAKLRDLELLLFACGIAFSAVYIKILYDEYINTRLGTPLFNIRRVPAPDPGKVKTIKLEYFIKLSVKLLILFGLFYMLINLGHFRNGYSSVPGNLAEVQAREPGILDYRFGSFMGITIMVPTIAGICLSLGFTIFTNRSFRRRSGRIMKKHFKTLETDRDLLQKLMIRQGQLNVYLKEWGQIDHKKSLLSSQFAGGYEQAYKRAYKKIYGYDFYNLVEEFQREAMFKNIKKSINPLNAPI